ncbi:MAG: choice-of-anchor D domain-containing protein [Myxococcota bacterium]
MLFFLFACSGQDTNINRITPDLAVSINEIDFGSVVIGETAEQSFQIINAGRGPLYISEIRVEGEHAEDFTPALNNDELFSEEIMDVPITLTPSDYIEYSVNLQIFSNDDENPVYTIPVTASGGDGPQPDLTSDASSLDFGEVQLGDEVTKYFTIQNAGESVLSIGSTAQTGSGAFSLVGDLDASTLSPGTASSILVTYKPFQSEGDSGALVINSNDPDEPEFTINFEGNGGGEFPYPSAEIDCPSGQITPPITVTLDGSASTDPNDSPLTFQWDIVDKPVGSVSALNSPQESTTDINLDAAGDYNISLTVTNEDGVVSSPAECLIEAIPPSDIHVELSWAEPRSDFDLHLLRAEDGIYTFNDDCCWCNPNPAWGGSGGSDDPLLALDSTDASAPEIIDLSEAPDGEYYIRAHYYSDNGGGDASATVRIYIEGELEAQYSKTLTHNQMWDVAFIRWPESYLIEENSMPYNYEGARSCQ